jgi:hypothetical protein
VGFSVNVSVLDISTQTGFHVVNSQQCATGSVVSVILLGAVWLNSISPFQKNIFLVHSLCKAEQWELAQELPTVTARLQFAPATVVI